MDQLLTRQFAFNQNLDPMGRKWGIGKVRGTSLYHVEVLEGEKAGEKPEIFRGKFTNPGLAQKTIEAYLNEMWDMNDEQVKKNARANKTKE